MTLTVGGRSFSISGTYINQLEYACSGRNKFSKTGARILKRKGFIFADGGVTPFGKIVIEAYRESQKSARDLVGYVKRQLLKEEVVKSLEFLDLAIGIDGTGTVDYKFSFEWKNCRYDIPIRFRVADNIWNNSIVFTIEDRQYKTYHEKITQSVKKGREGELVVLRLQGGRVG